MAAHQLRLTLKTLQSQRYALHQQLQTAQHADAPIEQIQSLQQDLRDVYQRITMVEQQTATIVVSEHALLRYFERILGYDLEVLRTALMPPATVDLVTRLGSGTYPVVVDGQTVRVRVQDRVATTVFPRKG